MALIDGDTVCELLSVFDPDSVTPHVSEEDLVSVLVLDCVDRVVLPLLDMDAVNDLVEVCDGVSELLPVDVQDLEGVPVGLLLKVAVALSVGDPVVLLLTLLDKERVKLSVSVEEWEGL